MCQSGVARHRLQRLIRTTLVVPWQLAKQVAASFPNTAPGREAFVQLLGEAWKVTHARRTQEGKG